MIPSSDQAQESAQWAARWFRSYHQGRARELTQDRTLDWDERTRAMIAEHKASAVYQDFLFKVP